MKGHSSLMVLSIVTVVAIGACAPAAPPPARQADEPAAAPASTAPQPVVVLVSRGEPPTLAVQELVPFSGSLRPPLRLFNATLDSLDEREVPHPYLAEAVPRLNTDTWRVFPDGRMETVYRLKPNLTWHDGKPLSAEDFAFAWRVYSNTEFGVAKSPPFVQMEEVTAPDQRTVVIRWREPFADAGALDAEFQALPRHILEGPLAEMDSQAFTGHPFWSHEYVGLGPYRLERWEPGAFIEGTAFDRHVLGRPKINRIKVLFISDPNTALANLLAGEAHFVGDFILSATDGLTLEEQWGSTGGTVLWAPTLLRISIVQHRPEATDQPALLDVRVRRAVAHGMDAATVSEVLNAGKAVVTSTLTSPRVDYYSQIEPLISKYPYDARRVQQLLEEVGFSKGADGFFTGRDGKRLTVSMWSSGGATFEQEAATFADSLRRTGIDATQQVFPAAQLRDAQARALIPGLSIRGMGARRLHGYTTEQIPSARNRWTGDNRGGWANAEYDRLFDAYLTTLDRTERIGVIGQMERLFTGEVGAIPHMFSVVVTAHVAGLKGPVARTTPEAGFGWLRVHEWEWRS